MSIDAIFYTGVLLGCVGGGLVVVGYLDLLDRDPKLIIFGVILLVGGGYLANLAAEISASA